MENRSRGFTLIEILVAIALSSIVITALLGVFLSFLEYQASSQDERDALESVRFVLSDVSRELSFGRDYRCGLTLNGQCVCLSFLDQLQRTTKIRHNAAAGRVEKSVQLLDQSPAVCAQAGDTSDINTWAPLTDNSVNITGLRFELETQINKQPRVKIFINADYEIEGTTETLAVKTQVTKRLFEPKSRALLESFRVGTRSAAGSDRVYFFYAQCRGTTERPCPDGKRPNEWVCYDSNNAPQRDDLCEKIVYKPIAAEFSEDGMFILVDNQGFVFHLDNGGIDDAMKVKGGSTPEYIYAPDILRDHVERVLGADGRGGNSDPRGVTSLHPAKETVLARRYDGALYQLEEDEGTRLLTGGISRNKAEQIGTERDRVFVSFADSGGERRLQLHMDENTLSGNLGPDQCNTEFTWVGVGSGCLRVFPEPSPDLDTTTSINSVIAGVFGTATGQDGISLSAISRLQILNGKIHIWYEDGTGKRMLSVGRSSDSKKRTLTRGASLNNRMINGGPLVQGDSTYYTFICEGGNALCRVADTDLFSDNIGTIAVNDRIPLRLDTDGDGDYGGRGEYNYGRVIQHVQYGTRQFGISNDGRILYFTGIGTASASVKELSVPVLCDVNSNPQSIKFLHISRKHPTKDAVALIGFVRYAGTPTHGEQFFNEVFLLTGAQKDQNAETICGKTLATSASRDALERRALPQSVPFDLIRLTEMAPRDKQGSPPPVMPIHQNG